MGGYDLVKSTICKVNPAADPQGFGTKLAAGMASGCVPLGGDLVDEAHWPTVGLRLMAFLSSRSAQNGWCRDRKSSRSGTSLRLLLAALRFAHKVELTVCTRPVAQSPATSAVRDRFAPMARDPDHPAARCRRAVQGRVSDDGPGGNLDELTIGRV